MDPLRLRHDGDDFERELLDSATLDRPEPGTRERLLDLLGVAGLGAGAVGITLANLPTPTVVASSGSVAAPTTAAAAAAPSAAAASTAAVGGGIAVAGAGAPAAVGAAGGAALGTAVLAKWLGAGLLVGLGSTALVSEIAAPAGAPTTSPSAQRAALVAPAPSGSVGTATGRSAPFSGDAQRGPDPTAEARAARVPTPVRRASVSDEITALDRARSALRDGDPAEAERQLGAYRARFAGGALGPEADLLSLEAVAARGDSATTAAAARAFLARHGGSPHAARARALLAASAPRTPSSADNPTRDEPSSVARFNETP